MLQELHDKMRPLNQIVAKWQAGWYADSVARKVIDQAVKKAFGQEGSEEDTRCGNPHNNGDDSCVECLVIKHNL